jgi:hypothetical protein
MPPENKGHIPWIGYLALGLPFAIYICVFCRYATNMPYFDDYDAILGWTVEFFKTHTLRDKFFLFFAQHNEHRIVFDYLTNLLSVAIYQRINFIFISLVGAIGLFGIAATMLVAGTRAGLSIYELIPIPILLLSLSQYEMIISAMASVQQYWQLLFLILSIVLLTVSSTKVGFALACLTGVMAIFSGGGGVLVFPVGMVYLVASRKWRYAVCWSILTAFTLYLFFVYFNYQPSPKAAHARVFFLSHPVISAEFFAAFLGNFWASPTAAMVSGILLLAAIAAMAIIDFRRLDTTVLYLGLAIFLSAVVVTENRVVVFGMQGSLASRYTIYGALSGVICYMLAFAFIRAKRWRYFVNTAGILIAASIYALWISPALTQLKHTHNMEKIGLLAWSGSAADILLQTTMQEHLFYPALLYRHLPPEIIHNRAYNRAWNHLFELYLVRPDLRHAFPLGAAESYAPLLKWAATSNPDHNAGFAPLVDFQPAYRSMLELFRH